MDHAKLDGVAEHEHQANSTGSSGTNTPSGPNADAPATIDVTAFQVLQTQMALVLSQNKTIHASYAKFQADHADTLAKLE